MPAHDPVVNPSVHYVGVEGAIGKQDHDDCIAQNERIKSERSSEYGPNGAYNHQMCNAHGIRFEGRGWNQDGAANGGENGIWYNAGSRSLCVLVGTDDQITDACKTGIRDWANEAVDRGMQWPLRGHSEFVATSCPGDNLRAVVDEINADPQGDDDMPLNDADKAYLGMAIQAELQKFADKTLSSWEWDSRKYVDDAITKAKNEILAAIKK